MELRLVDRLPMGFLMGLANNLDTQTCSKMQVMQQ